MTAASRLPERAKRLPLKPVDYLILVALASREQHGYAIKQDVESLSGGEVRLDAGNLYRSIRRLVSEQLVESAGERKARGSTDERRIYYRLSPEGRLAVTTETARLRRLLEHSRVRDLCAPVAE